VARCVIVTEQLELLRRHDVIVEDNVGIRFASELLRRWVAGQMRRH
jgi:hypothetical protein